MRAWPERHEVLVLALPGGATVSDALHASGWALPEDAPVGIWGKVQARDKPLREGDRVEIYRPLVADPKTARRKRAAR